MRSDHAAELSELMPEGTTVPRQGIGIDVRRLLKLRGVFMVLVFAGVFVPAAVLVWLLVPLFYVATVELEFSAVPTGIIEPGGRALTGPTYESFVNTQLQVLDGYTIAKRVVEDPEVRGQTNLLQDDWPIGTMIERLEADQQFRSEIVSVSYRDEDREDAILILGTVVDQYMAHLAEQEQSKGGLRRRTLAEKEEQLQQELDNLQQQSSQLRQQLGVPLGNTPGAEALETEALRENLAAAEADLTTANTRVRQIEGEIATVERYLERYQENPADPIFAKGIELAVMQHPAVELLTEQLAETRQEVSVLADRYVDEAPQLRVAQRERQALESELEETKAQVRGEAVLLLRAELETELEDFQAQASDAEQRREQFAGRLDEYRAESVELSKGLAEIDYLERRSEDLRARLEQVRNQIFTIDVESNAPARVESLGAPTAPESPSYEERLKFLLLAMLVAATIGVVSGVTWETLDQNIRSSEDVRYVTGEPILAGIPHTSEDRLPRDLDVATLSENHPDSATADEFRRVAARILGTPGRQDEVRTCVVVSPTRGDGKTTTACNLAIVLAQADRRVLLVDVDSRHPGVERAFGLRPSEGLAEMLGGEPLAHDPDRATQYENLYVLGPGLRSRELLERLASREMADFLAGAEDLFDHIIFDTPASLLMSESRLLTPMVDGIVVVVGSGVSTFGMLRRTLGALRDSNARLLGVVVNGLRQAPLGYLRRNLDNYYAGEKAQSPVRPRATAAPRRAATEEEAAPPEIVLLPDDERR